MKTSIEELASDPGVQRRLASMRGESFVFECGTATIRQHLSAQPIASKVKLIVGSGRIRKSEKEIILAIRRARQ